MYNNEFYPDYLAHYGVLGMKWGVRRYQNKDGSLTSAGKKRYLDEDNKNAIIIKKGSKVHRISNNPHEYQEPIRTYVSVTDADRDYYKGKMSVYIGSKYMKTHPDVKNLSEAFRKNPVYELEFKTTEDIIAPSHKASVDAFIKIYSSNKDMISDSLSKSSYLKEEESQKFIEKYKTLSVEKLKTDGYEAFSQSLLYSSTNRKCYFDELKKQGYNAVIDYNDVKNIKVEAPLIIFERSNTLKSTHVRKLSDKDIANSIYRDEEYKKKNNITRSIVDPYNNNPYRRILNE